MLIIDSTRKMSAYISKCLTCFDTTSYYKQQKSQLFYKIINITKRPQTNVILIVTKNIKVYF